MTSFEEQLAKSEIWMLQESGERNTGLQTLVIPCSSLEMAKKVADNRAGRYAHNATEWEHYGSVRLDGADHHFVRYLPDAVKMTAGTGLESDWSYGMWQHLMLSKVNNGID